MRAWTTRGLLAPMPACMMDGRPPLAPHHPSSSRCCHAGCSVLSRGLPARTAWLESELDRGALCPVINPIMMLRNTEMPMRAGGAAVAAEGEAQDHRRGARPVPEHWRGPAGCHQDLAMRAARVLGGPHVQPARQGAGDHWCARACCRACAARAYAGAGWCRVRMQARVACALRVRTAPRWCRPATCCPVVFAACRQEPAGAVRAVAAQGQVQDAPGPHSG